MDTCTQCNIQFLQNIGTISESYTLTGDKQSENIIYVKTAAVNNVTIQSGVT